MPNVDELVADRCRLNEVRRRLSSLSWCMRLLNEHIARRANVEDDVAGHFLEGHFKSTQLLDAFAILAGVMYVELNPIRAKQADAPDSCYHASVVRCIEARRAQQVIARRGSTVPAAIMQDLDAGTWLSLVDVANDPPDGMQSDGRKWASDRGFREMSLDQFLELPDW